MLPEVGLHALVALTDLLVRAAVVGSSIAANAGTGFVDVALVAASVVALPVVQLVVGPESELVAVPVEDTAIPAALPAVAAHQAARKLAERSVGRLDVSVAEAAGRGSAVVLAAELAVAAAGRHAAEELAVAAAGRHAAEELAEEAVGIRVAEELAEEAVGKRAAEEPAAPHFVEVAVVRNFAAAAEVEDG